MVTKGESSTIALGRRRQRDIEPPLFVSARRHNQIELTPVPRFLSLADSLYFRDSQTTQRRKRMGCIHAHTTPCLRCRKKARQCNGKRRRQESREWATKKEFGFPNELRLRGPEECVGILIKHQSYDENDWNCFLDHRRRGESSHTSAGPVSTRIRLDPSPWTRALFHLLRPIPRLSSADNKLHSDAMSSAHWFSRRVLRRFIPL